MKKLIKKLNELEILQTSEWIEDLPEDVYKEYFKNYEEYNYKLDVDTRRWYELSTFVVEIEKGLIGVRSISNVFSESMGWEDCGHVLEFFEMEEIKVTSYKRVEEK